MGLYLSPSSQSRVYPESHITGIGFPPPLVPFTEWISPAEICTPHRCQPPTGSSVCVCGRLTPRLSPSMYTGSPRHSCAVGGVNAAKCNNMSTNIDLFLPRRFRHLVQQHLLRGLRGNFEAANTRWAPVAESVSTRSYQQWPHSRSLGSHRKRQQSVRYRGHAVQAGPDIANTTAKRRTHGANDVMFAVWLPSVSSRRLHRQLSPPPRSDDNRTKPIS